MTVAFPMVSSLLARIIVLPASSAEVERVFSAVKRIKTPLTLSRIDGFFQTL